MDVSIIIVNWNVKPLLLRCVDSILQHVKGLAIEVIVVDNASNDGSVEAFREKFVSEMHDGRVSLIANRTNAGFSKANNQGWRESKGEYIVFMNPDMEFVEDVITPLRQFLIEHPQVGMVAPSLVYGDREPQPNVKRDPTLMSQLLIALKLHHVWGKSGPVARFLAKDFDYAQPAAVDQVMGAFMMMPRAVVEKMQGWDERYWLWWEDVDLCVRVRKAGYEIWYVPVGAVVHYEGRSFAQQMSVPKQKRFLKGMLIYFHIYKKWFSFAVITLFWPLSVGLAYITQLFKIKPKPQSRI